MNAILDRIRAAGIAAWLKFVQWLNGISIALLGGALIVHQSYPQLLGDLLGPIPLPAKAGLLFLFGVVVHKALAQAKKAAS